MKLSLKWLSELVDISGLNEKEVEERIVKAGFEVESVDHLGLGTNLVVGKVIECVEHPDSDHLHVTKTDIGSEVLQIVCGAPNCREGLKVIVAKPGAKLPGGEIKRGVIRGVESNGMLCSLLELNIEKDMLPENSPSQNGIEELDDRFAIGETDILNKLGLEDTIFDVSIYANRPDCLGMHNMAKEVAAILDLPCKLPEFAGSADIGTPTSFKLDSKSKNCPHFLAKVVNSVTIKESPEWMKNHLRANGVKSINNLVDISNYVMLETGQPMHFYDLKSNPNRNITVVDDYAGDYLALDGNTYKIEHGDLMITSDNQPIGIGGIMGGESSKVMDDTCSLLLESALFDHAQIRRTANRLGLQTEAAMRYAKGLEPLAQNKAMDRAVQLLIEYADATGFEETVEFGKPDYEPYEVVETLEHLNSLIGKNYTVDEVVSVLNRLDFSPRVEGEKIISTIPSRRASDIKIREDIDEEIVRLSGFDDLVSTLPNMPQTIGKLSPIQKMRKTIREVLMNEGLNEIATYTLVGQDKIDEACLPCGEAIALVSPMSDARKFVRNSIMNSVFEALAYNEAHSNENVSLFEISTVYGKGVQGERLGVVLSGNFYESKVRHEATRSDFYVLKGLLVEMMEALGFDKGRLQFVANDLDTKHFHPYQSALLKLNNEVVAILGTIHPSYASDMKLPECYYFEMMLDKVINCSPAKTKAPVVNKYPSVNRDISVVVKEEVSALQLIKAIKKAGKIIKSVEVFDVYRGDHIEDGYKSVSLNIVYEDADKTLKINDVNPIHEKVLEELNRQFGANLR